MQSRPRLELPHDRARALTERIQDAGTEVVKAKVRPLAEGLSMRRLASHTAVSFAAWAACPRFPTRCADSHHQCQCLLLPTMRMHANKRLQLWERCCN